MILVVFAQFYEYLVVECFVLDYTFPESSDITLCIFTFSVFRSIMASI